MNVFSTNQKKKKTKRETLNQELNLKFGMDIDFKMKRSQLRMYYTFLTIVEEIKKQKTTNLHGFPWSSGM